MIFELNCDMGEGLGYDELLMPYADVVNIACGFHAGSGEIIRRTMDLAKMCDVRIGAHPSFRDKENFGWKEVRLTTDKIYALVLEQLIRIDLIAKEKSMVLHHVKPHGALYTMALKDARLAKTIATAVHDFDENLVLYGHSGSCLLAEGKALGLQVRSEVFADRLYNDDGNILDSAIPGAILTEEPQGRQQVMQLLTSGTVTLVNGHTIAMNADSFCIHSVGITALRLAKMISQQLKSTVGQYDQH